jgi:tRNA-splicing ligase RtcB
VEGVREYNMKVLNFENGVHIKSWCDDIEDSAMKQIINLSKLPFAYHHVAIMPDCHSGYGMPIGGVLATKGVVIPNAVGVDIGCGMCACQTSLKAEQVDKEIFKKIMGKIKEVIPVGGNHHKKKQDNTLMPIAKTDADYFIVEREYDSALCQLGTLGGGNHFIEFQKDTEDNVWIMIHSGSRNLGYKVANYYNDVAVKLNEKWHSKVTKEWQLAFLPLDSKEGQDYLLEMQYCVDFALANRKLMMDRILKCIDDVLVEEFEGTNYWEHEPIINIAHNYASMENHFGENVMVHRKGATLAREDTIGIIPSSQGSKSYIVQGLGNKDSFMSCSHGAGRKMSRTRAENELNLEDEIKKLDDQGIVHGIRTKKDLDEASGAYKDINLVMESQKDLVKILVELTPLAVIKGD